MAKQIEIRQARADWTSALGLDKAYAVSDNGARKEDFGVLGTAKGALNWFHVRRAPDGRWATGIDELSSRFNYMDDPEKAAAARKKAKEERERFEALLGEDLSGTSSFWEGYTIPLVNPRGPVIFKMDHPKDELMVKVALASGLVAPSFDDLNNDEYYSDKCRFYIYNAEEVSNKRNTQALKRSQAIGSLYNIKDNKERLYYISKTLNIAVSNQMSADAIYLMLLEYVQHVPINRMDSVTEVFSKQPKDLQVTVKVREAMEKGIFKWNKDLKSHVFLGQKVGSNFDQMVQYFNDKENISTLEALEGVIEGEH